MWCTQGKERGRVNNRKCIFQLLTMTSTTEPTKYSVRALGEGCGEISVTCTFWPALPQGNFCGELFSHSLHFITLGIFTESDHNNIKT